MKEEDEQTFYSINSGNFYDIDDELHKPNSEKSYLSGFSKLCEIDQKGSYYFICKECHFSPMITFGEFYVINANCECREIINSKYDEFMEKYSSTYSKDTEKYFYCKFHKSNKYECYCVDCKFNLCLSCLDNKIHKNHTTPSLLDNDTLIEEVKTLIDDIKDITPNSDEYNILFLIKKINIRKI